MLWAPPQGNLWSFVVPLDQWFSICGSLPLWGINQHFAMCRLRPPEDSDIWVTVAKISYEVAREIMLWLEVTRAWGTLLKGHSIGEVEDYWLRAHPGPYSLDMDHNLWMCVTDDMVDMGGIFCSSFKRPQNHLSVYRPACLSVSLCVLLFF